MIVREGGIEEKGYGQANECLGLDEQCLKKNVGGLDKAGVGRRWRRKQSSIFVAGYGERWRKEEAKQHFVRNLAVKAFPHGKAISGGNLWRQSLEAISGGNLWRQSLEAK